MVAISIEFLGEAGIQSLLTGLPELCLKPERWSWREVPLAAQSDADSGSVHTHYRDSRTVRVHRLAWDQADAAERSYIASVLPSEIEATSARFSWKTPRGELVAVTVRQLPNITRLHHATGAFEIELEEALLERAQQIPIGGALYIPGSYYTPGFLGLA